MHRTKRAHCAISTLEKVIQRRTTELVHENPYELLVATVLSAQCTDERVNQVTPSLFDAFPSVHAMAEISSEDILPYIKSVTYPNSKSRHLSVLSKMIVSDFGGEVPRTVDELRTLPGVGQKTAQVVAAGAFGVPTLAVDTHVFRTAHRIGLVPLGASTPEKVEKHLKNLVPREKWADLHHILIFHGRYTCRARAPQCGECVVKSCCRYGAQLERLPAPIEGLDPKRAAYYCATRRHYFDEPDRVSDRSGLEQISCPRCGSMNVFMTKSGATTKRIRDFRVN